TAAYAEPLHAELRALIGSRWDSTIGKRYEGAAAWSPDEIAQSKNNWVDRHMRTYEDPASGGSHIVQTEDYDPGYTPDFSALYAERDRVVPYIENYNRQQQAYNWMQGGNQENAVMSPEYAQAGFNTITGMSNPYAGPGEISGVDMDWAQGVY